jgi:hypothetical protein
MTADVSAHVDRLAGAALNVSRVDRNMKLEYLRDFEAQSNKLSSKVARVRNHACLTISNSKDVEKVEMVRVTCDFLDRLTPQVIASARGLAGKCNICFLFSFFAFETIGIVLDRKE